MNIWSLLPAISLSLAICSCSKAPDGPATATKETNTPASVYRFKCSISPSPAKDASKRYTSFMLHYRTTLEETFHSIDPQSVDTTAPDEIYARFEVLIPEPVDGLVLEYYCTYWFDEKPVMDTIHRTFLRQGSLDYSQTVIVKAPVEKVWQALVDPALVAQYHLAPLNQIQLKPGGALVYGTPEEPLISGTILDLETNRWLQHSFRFRHSGTDTDPDSMVAYELIPHCGGTKLILRHWGFKSDNQTRANIIEGWPHILQSLKQLLESRG